MRERRGFDPLLDLARMIEARGADGDGHADRLARSAEMLARATGMPETDVAAVKLGAHLHDIGKVMVPEWIIWKTGPLTDDETTVMRGHPIVGAQMLTFTGVPAGAREIVLRHHERFDGTGYPMGLTGPKLPVTSRIVTIADAYDAMRSNRPYRRALSRDEAIRRLRDGAGRQFDPDLVEPFCALAIPEPPIDEEPIWQRMKSVQSGGGRSHAL
ncbi:MAG TPA: HD-GYP domain-containing protein [Actinomycetota bacterium]|nr:HD-GYP domain-containing protein [Actinomycetota bacterium]